MFRKTYNVLLATLLFVAAIVGMIWIHSDMVGYERTWTDQGCQICGRITSAKGHFVYQWCDLKSRRQPTDPTMQWERRIPANFLVGSNPTGEQTVISCGPFAIPFTFPAEGLFIGQTTRIDDIADPVSRTRWSNDWSEFTISYWFIFIVFMAAPTVAGIQWLREKYRTVS